jgi:adenine-specific DNA-methyltransferase
MEPVPGPESTATQSPSLANLEAFRNLFPGVVQDGVLDAGRLGEALGIDVSGLKDGKERFGLMWAGRQKAVEALQAPSYAALVPDKENSVNWDSGENVFIEGDNLEVLKLMQNAYNDQVKLIYIDPPYNTGNDFVYNDDFSDPKQHYLEVTGQVDAEGNRLVANTEVSGRKHSNWLTMMYPRLVLARNLLTQDGLIFISINDAEQPRLRVLCDEVFGEENFVANLVWLKGKEGGNDNYGFGPHHEYVLCYARNFDKGVSQIRLDDKDTSRHVLELGEPNLVVEGEVQYREGEPFQLINLSKQKDYRVQIPLRDGPSLEWPSYAPQKTIDEYIRLNKVFVGKKGVPYVKSFLADEKSGAKPSSIIESKYGTTKAGGIALRELFGNGKVFSYPKPPQLVQRLVELVELPDNNQPMLVLDLFAGSCTTAQAVYAANLADGGNRNFVAVTLAESVEEDSVAAELGYKYISDVGRARIIRAAETLEIDASLRCFRIAPAPFEPFMGGEDALLLPSATIRPGATDEEVIAFISLSCGVPLSLSWLRLSTGVVKVGSVLVATGNPGMGLLEMAQANDCQTIVVPEDQLAGQDDMKANLYFACKKANITFKTF